MLGYRQKVFEDTELDTLLNKYRVSVKKKVAQHTISEYVKDMRMIQKQGNWMPYEFKPRNIEHLFTIVKQRRKGALELIESRNETKTMGYSGDSCTWITKPNVPDS